MLFLAFFVTLLYNYFVGVYVYYRGDHDVRRTLQEQRDRLFTACKQQARHRCQGAQGLQKKD